MELKVENLTVWEHCHSGKENLHLICNEFSYTFKSGSYILQGDIDHGAWAFTFYLTDYSKSKMNWPETRLYLDGEMCDIEKIRQTTFYLGHVRKDIPIIHRTVEDIIDRALKKGKCKYSKKDLCDMFEIDERTIKRDVKMMIPSRVRRTSAAIGFAMGKRIYVSPWYGQFQLERHQIDPIIRNVNNEGYILIMPMSSKINYWTPDEVKYVEMISLFSEAIYKKYSQ